MIRQIITSYWPKPIPDRSWDWSAYIDGQEEVFTGYGSTEDRAIADLREQIDEIGGFYLEGSGS